MKVFITSVVTAAIIAVAASLVLTFVFQQSAESAFSASSARP